MSLCQFSPARRTPIGLPSSVTLDTTTISGLPGTLHRSPKMLNSISPKRRVKATCCRGRDALIAEEDYGVIIVSALDSGERLVVATALRSCLPMGSGLPADHPRPAEPI